MDTKQLKQKILDLAIRGKLVPQDPNDEPASVLLERIRAEKEQLIAQGKLKKSKSKISDKPHYENVPFEIPDSWEWVMVEDIASIIHGRSQSAVINPDGIYPIYGSGGIMGYADDYLCPEHCTIIGRKGTINNPILIETKFWNVDTAFGLHPHEAINYIYFHYFCKSFDFTKLDKSTTLPSLTKTSIEQIHFPLPPLTEQQRIVAEVEKWFALIDELEANKEDLKDYIKQVKSKVLDLAIHGKLVPQAPNDEPAIELLKRIDPNFKPCDTSHYENLPSGWIVSTIGEVAQYINGRAFKPTEWEKEGIPIIRIQNLNDPNAPYNYSTVNYEDKYLIKDGDLLFAWAASLGAYIWKGSLGWLNQHIFKVEPKEFMNKQYLYYSFINLIADFYRQSHGSGMVHITKGKFENTPILIPPLDEQERINITLENIFNILDNISAES